MSVKLDMSNAFDRLEWTFICATLKRFGFPLPFVELIRSCISSVSFSFILNGGELGMLRPGIGIRQGDPLSPYLFIMCSEVFSNMLNDMVRVQNLKGIGATAYGPKLTHLFFADDTLLFAEVRESEAESMQWAISTYESISVQQINTDKFGILFSPNTSTDTRRRICFLLKVPEVESHGTYLGLPSEVGQNKNEVF